MIGRERERESVRRVRERGRRERERRERDGEQEGKRKGGREEKRVLAHFLPITRSQKTLGIRSVSNRLNDAATMLFIAVSQLDTKALIRGLHLHSYNSLCGLVGQECE